MHYLSFKFVCSWVLYWFGFLKLWSVCFVHVWFNLLKKTDHLSSFYELEYECILTYFLFRKVFIAHRMWNKYWPLIYILVTLVSLKHFSNMLAPPRECPCTWQASLSHLQRARQRAKRKRWRKYTCAVFLLRMGDFGKIDKLVCFLGFLVFFPANVISIN